MFVEAYAPFAPNEQVDPQEYFLGIADCACIRSWNLCGTILSMERKEDCIFREGNDNIELTDILQMPTDMGQP